MIEALATRHDLIVGGLTWAFYLLSTLSPLAVIAIALYAKLDRLLHLAVLVSLVMIISSNILVFTWTLETVSRSILTYFELNFFDTYEDSDLDLGGGVYAMLLFLMYFMILLSVVLAGVVVLGIIALAPVSALLSLWIAYLTHSVKMPFRVLHVILVSTQYIIALGLIGIFFYEAEGRLAACSLVILGQAHLLAKVAREMWKTDVDYVKVSLIHLVNFTYFIASSLLLVLLAVSVIEDPKLSGFFGVIMALGGGALLGLQTPIWHLFDYLIFIVWRRLQSTHLIQYMYRSIAVYVKDTSPPPFITESNITARKE